MKLDSKIIGALIIGISILISTFFYAKNTDYQSCVKERYKYEKETSSPNRAKYRNMDDAHKVCSKLFFGAKR
jgi:hypothetical protein